MIDGVVHDAVDAVGGPTEYHLISKYAEEVELVGSV